MFQPEIIKPTTIALLVILEVWAASPHPTYGANGAPSPQRTAIPVEVARVRKRDINTFLLFNCTIEPEKQVDIMAKTSGQVEEIFVEEGQRVVKDQALAKLDEAESFLALKEAQIRLENVKLAYERSQRTYKDKITSKEQLDESRLQYETSRVDYERKSLEYTYNTIASPIDGIIVSRVIEIGTEVEKNQKVFSVADFNPLLARIHVPEKDLSKIREGQSAIITIESLPEQQFRGRVKMISPVVDPESGTIKVTIEIEYTEDSPLRPGMFASVFAITERHANALSIPKKALIFESEGAEVFVVKHFAILSLTRGEGAMFAVGDDVTLSFGFSSTPVVGMEEDGTSTRSMGTNSAVAASQPPADDDTEPVAREYVNGIVSETQPSGRITIELLDSPTFLTRQKWNRVDVTNVDSGADTVQVQEDAISLETRGYKTKVELGFSEGNEVEVISGPLKEGDLIITVGQEDLGHGAAVNIVAETGTDETPIDNTLGAFSLQN